MPSYVLDTSALVTILQNEPGAERVLAILEATKVAAVGPEAAPHEPTRVYLPFMALMELDYLSRQGFGEQEARRICDLVGAWPVEIVESNESWRSEAARIKAEYPLSLADAWICGLAIVFGAQLVHKDPHFDDVVGLRSVRLPDKVAPRS